MLTQNIDAILTIEEGKIYIETFNNFRMCSIKIQFEKSFTYNKAPQFQNKSIIYNFDRIWNVTTNPLKNIIFTYGNVNQAISSEGEKSLFLVCGEENKIKTISDISNEFAKHVDESRIQIINVNKKDPSVSVGV